MDYATLFKCTLRLIKTQKAPEYLINQECRGKMQGQVKENILLNFQKPNGQIADNLKYD